MQLAALREHARVKGWAIAKEYVDHGWSGAKDQRPKLNELMADAEKGRVDFQAVMVWKFDRFARSLQHLLKALTTFKDFGIAFVSITESADTSTPMGTLMFQMLGCFAEFERNVIAERIREGFKDPSAQKPGPKIGAEGPSRTTLWRREKDKREGRTDRWARAAMA
jgi:DNA invertase Pin-like site-specific DNA recombinase